MQFDYLMLGGGVAAHRAAEEVRKGDANASIAIISDEPYRLYSRVMLPHVLHGKVPREKVFLVTEDWYEKLRITRVKGVVESLDAQNHVVALEDQSEIKFSKLLIATGGKPRVVDVPGTPCIPFRGLDDTDRIAAEIKKLEALPVGERIVGVYGAGFIAAEFINLLIAHKCTVHVFFRGTRFWGRQLDEKSSRMLEEKLLASGAVLHANASFVDLIQWAPQLKLVGVGIGIVPSFAFLENTKIKFDNGVRCNEFLETGEQNVWAAGDVAEFDDVITKRPQLVGTWLNAEMQGRRAGKNMLGNREPFKLVTSYATKLLDTSITMIGEVRPMDADTVKVDEEGGGIIQRLYRNQKLIGATLVGTAHGRMDLQKQIES